MLILRNSIAILCLMFAATAHSVETVSGRFDLIDHRGAAVSETSFDGKYRLVFFGFTRCPVICPTTMLEVTRAMKLLGERADRVQPLFITIDPANDTVDNIASYVRHFHPSLVGLTGSRQQIAAAAKSFNVTFGGTDISAAGDSTEIYHSSYLYLMNRDGSFLDVFGYGDKAESIVEVLDKYLPLSAGEIQIVDAWASEPTGSKSKTIAGFMCIQNDRSAAIHIVGASSSSVQRIEIHEIHHEQGIVRMKQAAAVEIAANSTVCLQPQQLHLMLFGIDEKIRAGADVELDLLTASGEKLTAVLPQRPLSSIN